MFDAVPTPAVSLMAVFFLFQVQDGQEQVVLPEATILIL